MDSTLLDTLYIVATAAVALTPATISAVGYVLHKQAAAHHASDQQLAALDNAVHEAAGYANDIQAALLAGGRFNPAQARAVALSEAFAEAKKLLDAQGVPTAALAPLEARIGARLGTLPDPTLPPAPSSSAPAGAAPWETGPLPATRAEAAAQIRAWFSAQRQPASPADDGFGAALAFTLGQEGGWADNPADPGGATMKGITLATFRGWRGNQAATADDLRGISDAEVEAIYRGLYWAPPSCARLAPGVGLFVFDMAVSVGVRRASLLLQAALGFQGADLDGSVGPHTLAAASKEDAAALLGKLGMARETFYRQCANFPTFGRGWLARNAACLAAARAAAQLPSAAVPKAA